MTSYFSVSRWTSMYCYCRCLASLYGWGSWPQLLFWLVNFYFFNLCSLMANNEGQYNPRAQAMEEVHFDWKCIVCSMVALSPIWNSNTSLGLNLFILIWTIPLGLNVTSATPPFIYSVGPGNQFMLLDPDIFFAPSSVVDSSNLSSPLLISIYSFPCHLKMAQKRKCPNDKKLQKPKGDRGGSTHYKQSIGNFKAETMQKCIKEIKRVESMPVPPRMKHPSRNEIVASFGPSPSSVSKRMMGKVLSMGPALGGA